MPVTQAHRDLALKRAASEGRPVLEVAPAASLPAGLPVSWTQALAAPDPRAAVLSLWKPFASRLPRVLKILRDSLQGVGLLSTASRPPSLVYFLTDGDGDPVVYRGFVPAATVAHPRASALPPDFLAFYQVHDGWWDLSFQALGPAPPFAWHFLSDDPEQHGSTFLVVFNDGGGSLLGFDLDEKPPLAYILRGGEDEPPELVPDVWERLDAWISAQLAGLKPA